MKNESCHDSGQLKLQLLKDRYEFQSLLLQKAEAVRLQRYNDASELHIKQNEIRNRLILQHEKCKNESQQLEFLPDNLLQLVFLDNLLAEFHDSDPELGQKLITLRQSLDSQLLAARNLDEKARVNQICEELLLVKEAVDEYQMLQKRLHIAI